MPLGRGPAGPRGRPVRKVPGQQESVGGLSARRDLAREAERAGAGALVSFGPESPIFGEVVPVEHGTGPPFGGRPTAQITHAPSARVEQAKGEGSPQRIGFGQLRIGHTQPLQRSAVVVGSAAEFGSPAIARRPNQSERIIQSEGNGNRRSHGAGVANPVAQDGRRETGRVGVQRDERAEGLQAHAHRQAGILERDPRPGKLSGEGSAFEPAQAGRIVGTQSRRAGIGRRQARFQDPGHGLAVAAPCPDGRECIARRPPLVGTVEDLPIAKLPASAQADAAGPDTAERKRQHRQLVAGKGAGIADALRGAGRDLELRGLDSERRQVWKADTGGYTLQEGAAGGWVNHRSS